MIALRVAAVLTGAAILAYPLARVIASSRPYRWHVVDRELARRPGKRRGPKRPEGGRN